MFISVTFFLFLLAFITDLEVTCCTIKSSCKPSKRELMVLDLNNSFGNRTLAQTVTFHVGYTKTEEEYNPSGADNSDSLQLDLNEIKKFVKNFPEWSLTGDSWLPSKELSQPLQTLPGVHSKFYQDVVTCGSLTVLSSRIRAVENRTEATLAGIRHNDLEQEKLKHELTVQGMKDVREREKEEHEKVILQHQRDHERELSILEKDFQGIMKEKALELEKLNHSNNKETQEQRHRMELEINSLKREHQSQTQAFEINFAQLIGTFNVTQRNMTLQNQVELQKIDNERVEIEKKYKKSEFDFEIRKIDHIAKADVEANQHKETLTKLHATAHYDTSLLYLCAFGFITFGLVGAGIYVWRVRNKALTRVKNIERRPPAYELLPFESREMCNEAYVDFSDKSAPTCSKD